MRDNHYKLFIGLIQSFLTFLKILVRSKFFLLKYSVDGGSCVILGNGPSLRKTLIDYEEQLKVIDVLGVNNLTTTDVYTRIKPRYFLITSSEFWNPGSIKKDQDNRDNIIDQMIKKTSWPLVFFVPALAKSNPKFINNIKQNQNIEIYFFNNTPVEGNSSMNNFFMSRGWGLSRPHNVLIPSIYNIVNAGYTQIYLIGADHSWLPLISVNDKNEALLNQQHFYDEENPKSETMHQNSKPRHLHQILEKFMLSFRSYFELKDYAASKGVDIYNCTPGSFIDAFERKDLSEVFAEIEQKQDSFVSK